MSPCIVFVTYLSRVSNPIGTKFKFRSKHNSIFAKYVSNPIGTKFKLQVQPLYLLCFCFKSHRDKVQIVLLICYIHLLWSFKSHRDKVQIEPFTRVICLFIVSNPIGTKFKSHYESDKSQDSRFQIPQGQSSNKSTVHMRNARKGFKSHRDKVQIKLFFST